MLGINLAQLRKVHHLTQEMVAEKINVSRQAVAKWENGESLPDIVNCIALADLYGVTLDNLIHYSPEESGLLVPPKGKHFFGVVTVGERGQIVIPKKAREVFAIGAGDQLLMLGDEERGLAIVHQRNLVNFVGVAGMAYSEPSQKGALEDEEK